MIGAGGLGRQQHEHRVYRLAIQRLEIYRPLETRKEAVNPVERWKFAVRNGNAGAKCRRAELLALQQDIENLTLWTVPSAPASFRCEFLQRLLFAAHLQ